MLASRSSLRAVLLALLFTASGSPARAAWPNDPTVNVPVCTAANAQQSVSSTSDGSGGTIIVWADLRSGTNYDIYAQRISPAGLPLWTANGVPVCTAANTQDTPNIVPDGAGGAYIAWTDFRSGTSFDVYAQRLNSAGAAQWTANGVPVCTATGMQFEVRIAADGAAGMLLSWSDFRSTTNYDVYAQKLSAAGVVQWISNGLTVCNATLDQRSSDIASDGLGGAVLAWHDPRSGAGKDIYAQRLTPGGGAVWTANGFAVCTSAGDQLTPRVLGDGQGGLLVFWADFRGGATSDLYGQRVLSVGASGWTSGGIPICNAAGSNPEFNVVGDGSSGAFLVWSDDRSGTSTDIYAQRVAPTGAAYWTANGVAVSTSADDAGAPVLAADGAGGVLLAWNEFRGGLSYDLFAQRLAPNGAAQWTSNGVAVSLAAYSQVEHSIVSDGAGGGILGWRDGRTIASNDDIYCQRVERYGQLGNPEPAITSVGDVKNDQGGFVKVTWNASYLDADPTYGITEYRVFRSVPGALLASPSARAGATTDSDVAVREGRLLVRPFGATVTTWEFVGSQAAEAFPSYSRVVATTADSIGGSNPRTYFLVEARASTSISSDRWSSAPDSGYSVDNLPPAAPAPLTGQYALGTTRLHWNRNVEGDLAGYRLYRGSSAAFVPGPSSFVGQLPDTGAVDAAGAPYVYKLTAVDAHGNESPVATLIPSGTLGVGDGPARAALAFAAPSPNPARGAATLRFSLSHAGPVKLALFDAAGRRVATLAEGVMEAGEHSATFALRDDAGHELAAGLYLARLEAEGRTLTRRIAAVR